MTHLRTLLLGPQKLLFLLVGLALGILCASVPVTSALDYPLSLVLAPLFGVAFLVWGAFRLPEPDEPFWRPWAVLASTFAAALIGPAAASAMGHVCEPVYGFGFLVLGPLMSGACGLAAGGALRRFVTRRWLRIVLVVALILGDVLIALAEFYFTPSVRFYGWLFGMYHGAIYDEAVRITAPYLWMRTRDLLWVLGLVVWGRSEVGRFTHWVALAGAVLLLALSPWLKYAASYIPLQSALSQAHQTSHFTVWTTPSGKASAIAPRLAEDLEFRLWQQQQFLGVREPGDPIDVYLYESPAQKESLMGAGKTTISKPWRNEVHLHSHRPTESLIAHELAHVVLASYSDALLAVPSSWGLVPKPGILEGAATAVERGSATLTAHGWARAMRDIGKLPDMESILSGLSFWGHSGALAYTASGSFIRHLLEEHGAERFAALYGGASFLEAYGREAGELLAEWNEYLDTVPVSETDLLFAEFLFTQPSVFEKVCPYAGARCFQSLAAAIRGKRTQEALGLARRTLLLTDGDVRLGKEVGRLLLAIGEESAAREILGVDPGLDVEKAGRSMEIALLLWDLDARWLLGRGPDALAGYQELAADAAAARMLGTELGWRLALSSRASRLPVRRLLLTPMLDDQFENTAAELVSESNDLPLEERLLLGRSLLGKVKWEEKALGLLLPWLDRGMEAWLAEVKGWKQKALTEEMACSLYVDLALKASAVQIMRGELEAASLRLASLMPLAQYSPATPSLGACFTPGIEEAITDLQLRVLWKRQYLGMDQEKTGQQE